MSDAMFEILQKGRVDYFPRSMLGIWREATKFSRQRLVVEQNLAFFTPLMFFILCTLNNLLGDAIESRLHSVIADGSFTILFDSVEGDVLNKVNLVARKLIHRDNPNVNKEGVYQWPNILGN